MTGPIARTALTLILFVSACAGTFDTPRAPTVENGVGVSKARNIGFRKFLRTSR